MPKHFSISLLVSFIFLLCSPGIHGTQPTIPTKDIEMNLTFSPEPELGKEFTVTFTFTPREEIPHKNELNDEAKIVFGGGMELVSGSPYWEGRLQANKTETIKIVLKATKLGRYMVSGLLRYCQVDPKFVPPDPELERETGMKFFGKVFEYHDGTGKQFWIGEPDDKIDIWLRDLKTGESKKVKVERRSFQPFDQPVVVGERAISGVGGKDSVKGTLVFPREKEYGFPLKKKKESSDSGVVNYIGSMSLRKGESAIVFLFDQDKETVVKALWHCEPESSCKIDTLPNHKVRITSYLESGNYIIIGTFNGIQYRIRVTTTTTDYHISGRFRYVDNWGNTQDMQEMVVESWYRSGGNWVPESLTSTDDWGYFDIYTPGHDTMAFIVYSYHWTSSSNTAGGVFATDGDLSEGDTLWSYIWGPAYIDVFQDYQIPESHTTCTDSVYTGAYEIVNVIHRGYDYVTGIVGQENHPSFSYCYWDIADTSAKSSLTRFAVGDVRIIEIQGEAVVTRGQRDQWDEAVVLHEYGHFAMDEYAQLPPKSGGPHTYWLQVPVSDSQIPENLAWSEAWAHFFSCASRSDIMITSSMSNLNNDNTTYWNIDLEVPRPDVPYYNLGWNQQVPSNPTPHYDGYLVEGALAETLWDIFDILDDSNYVVGGQIYGHNNDSNSNATWNGIDTIWDVFENYDPAPGDTIHNHCYDFYEFRNGWREMHPDCFDYVFQHILMAHNVDPYGTGIEEEQYVSTPCNFSLSQNYPNPFNPGTKIEFGLAESMHVKLCIYNIMGQKVKTLVNEEKSAGTHRIHWDGTDDKGEKVASGIYFSRVKIGDVSEVKKMVLLK